MKAAFENQLTHSHRGDDAMVGSVNNCTLLGGAFFMFKLKAFGIKNPDTTL